MYDFEAVCGHAAVARNAELVFSAYDCLFARKSIFLCIGAYRHSVAEWLRRWTRNSQVASSIPGRDAVE